MPPEVILHWDWPPLSDEAIVVRGGKDWVGKNLWGNAKSVYLETADPPEPGIWGLCVGASDEGTAREIAERMPYGVIGFGRPGWVI